MTQILQFRGEYRFLSNFYPVNIEYEGIEYPSVEHAYQACKSVDDNIRLEISKMTTGKAKEFGKTIKYREDWVDVKVPLMKNLLLLKFQNEELKQKLISTGDDFIVEGNDWGDTFWGVCNGRGHNMLGVLLMYVRWHIKIL
jgi:predicted NAD-dependent protein-ADP-ribosyltransferase YbiA (DUF1768 family)